MSKLNVIDINIGDVVYTLEHVSYLGDVGFSIRKYTITKFGYGVVFMKDFNSGCDVSYSTSYDEAGDFIDIHSMYDTIDDAYLNAIQTNTGIHDKLAMRHREDYEKVKKMRLLKSKI